MNANPSTKQLAFADWEPLIGALRAELQELGGLLRLLSEEQATIFSGAPAPQARPDAIRLQKELVAECNRARVCHMHSQGPAGERVSATTAEILRISPPDLRPLLGALFVEVERLTARTVASDVENDSSRVAGQG